MAQTYTNSNLEKYAIGKQIDIAIASGASATSATEFYSVKEFTAPNAPEPIMIEDAEGNRSTNTYAVIGDRQYPFSFSGAIEVWKIGRFLYHLAGSVSSVQDGATGAYKHTFSLLNNVILPQFTVFFDVGAEGYKRLTGCSISMLTLDITDTEATFQIEGWALNEDDTTNDASAISGIGVSAVTWQSNGLTRYQFGAQNFASVKNGDVLDTSAATEIVNASNKGKFIIVNVDDTNNYLDVINNNRTSATGDEAALTPGTAIDVHVLNTPSYPEPLSILLRRHSAVRNAEDTSGLAAASDRGLKNFNIEINNNSSYIFERTKSSSPLAVFAKNLTVGATFTQVMGATNAADAARFRDGAAIQQAWRFELEDQSAYLGTSTNYYPMLRVEIPQALGIATRTNMGSNDELSYDWALSVSREQSVTMVLQNETASYS